MYLLTLDDVVYTFRLATVRPGSALITVDARHSDGDTASTVFTVHPLLWLYDQAEGSVENPFMLDGSWPFPPPDLIEEARQKLQEAH